MSRAVLLAFLLVLVAACGKEEAAQPAAEEPAAVEDTAVDEAATAAETAETETAEEVVEVVEESAAEPEADEQAILLAKADVPPPQEWKFREREHFDRLVPTQPTIGGADKVEVAEFFYYMCPACDRFESVIRGWTENKPANARFVQVPVMWNQLLILHARLFYTGEVLARNGVIEDGQAFQSAVFNEIHRRNNRLTSEGAIQRLFTRFGVSEDEFKRTWNSFEVDQKLRVAQDLGRRYGVSSTPTVVVNGKYRTDGTKAGNYQSLLELIDELVVRESIR